MQNIKIETVTEVNLARDTQTDIIKIGVIVEGKMQYIPEMRFRLNKNNTVTVL